MNVCALRIFQNLVFYKTIYIPLIQLRPIPTVINAFTLKCQSFTNAQGASCSALLVKCGEDGETKDDEMGWACGKQDTE
jgi:hypothetical protein